MKCSCKRRAPLHFKQIGSRIVEVVKRRHNVVFTEFGLPSFNCSLMIEATILKLKHYM